MNRIDKLQHILSVTDEYIADKLKVSKNVFKRMKKQDKQSDYLKIKSVLVHERVEVIKFLK